MKKISKRIPNLVKGLFILLFIAVSGSALCYLYIFDKISPVIEDRVYRSAQLSGKELERLIKDKGIKTIINLRGEFKSDERYNREIALSKSYGVKHYNLRLVADKLPDYLKLKTLVEIISSSEKPLLIHCRYGIDRTGMASALALSIEKNAPLSEMKQQFSWKHGVMPFVKSVGPYFFSKYEEWLKEKGQQHNKDTLLNWIHNEYIDEQENVIAWVDHANGERFDEKKRKVRLLNGNSQKIIMEGWAFDARLNKGVDSLTIVIDKNVFKAPPATDRSDVARNFNLGERYYERFVVGWKIEIGSSSINKGCHEIYLGIHDNNSVPKILPSGSTLCI